MASGKNRPSKAERQRRNRAKREARQARSEHAGEATAMAGADDGGDSGPSEGGTTSKRTTTKGGGGRARTQQTGPTIPGQRAVLMAFLFSLVSVALLIFLPVGTRQEVPVDDPRVEEQDVEVDEGDETAEIVVDQKLFEDESLGYAAAVILIPVILTGAAVYATRDERRSTWWTMCLIGLAAYVFFVAGGYGFFTLAPLVALGVGGFQARRAEGKERVAALKAEREAEKARKDRGEVIDADVVEDDDEDEDDHRT